MTLLVKLQILLYLKKEQIKHLGGFLFMVYIIIILLLALVYFYDYVTNDKYQFNYTLLKNAVQGKAEWYEESVDMKNMLYTDLDYMIALYKGHQLLSGDFIILDLTKLSENKTILNSTTYSNNDNRIIKNYFPFSSNVERLELGVLYRCNGTNCTHKMKIR